MTSSPDIDFDFIKKWLEYGDITSLAEKYGIKQGTAYQILRKRKNLKFIAVCYKKALENARMFALLEQQKQELNKNLYFVSQDKIR